MERVGRLFLLLRARGHSSSARNLRRVVVESQAGRDYLLLTSSVTTLLPDGKIVPRRLRGLVPLRWDRVRARDLGRESHYSDLAAEAALRRDARPQNQISKAQAREQAAAAVANYEGSKLIELECKCCHHKGTARIKFGTHPTFKCSCCGSLIEP